MSVVAMIGLGRMGSPIARNLIGAGHEVRIYNRTGTKAQVFAGLGAVLADSPAEAVAGAGVVVSSLLDDASMLDLAQRADGLLVGMEDGALHICTTTISPGCALELERLHNDAGQRFVAAPVIGRPPAAEAGALIVLAAGSDDAIADARPVLGAFASRIVHAGADAACACTMKLAVNFFIVSMIELFGELFAFTGKGGIAPDTMQELLSTMLAHPALEEYLARVSERRFDDASFEAITGLKDVGLMLDRAHELRAPLPYASIVRDRLLTAAADGMGQMDWSVIAEIARRQTGS